MSGDVTRGLSRRFAFGNASFALVSLMASMGAPVALYGYYAERYAITERAVTFSYGAYIIGAALAMLMGGQLSNFIGRRVVGVAALVAAAAASFALVYVDSSAMLVCCRGVQGLAVGLGMPALAAYVFDLRAPGTEFLASLITSATPTLGIGLGAVISGGVVELGPRPSSLVYQIFAALILVSAVGIVLSHETSQRMPGVLRSLRPALAVPTRVRSRFVGVVAAFVAGWSVGGLYQALGPSIADDYLGNRSQLFAGLVVASMLTFTAVGGPLTSRMPPRAGCLSGLAALVIGICGVLAAASGGSTSWFFVTSAVAGAGFGAACTGAMRAIVSDVTPRETAGLISAVYLTSYMGAAIPSFVSGQFLPHVGLAPVLEGYVVTIALLASIAATLILTGSRTAPAEDIPSAGAEGAAIDKTRHSTG